VQPSWRELKSCPQLPTKSVKRESRIAEECDSGERATWVRPLDLRFHSQSPSAKDGSSLSATGCAEAIIRLKPAYSGLCEPSGPAVRVGRQFLYEFRTYVGFVHNATSALPMEDCAMRIQIGKFVLEIHAQGLILGLMFFG
jgi:hypothetical protein